MITFIGAVIFLIVVYYIYQKFERRKFPPGPIPLPIIGSLIEVVRVGGLPHEAMFELSKKYGNLFSIKIGSVQTVVVSGNDMIRNFLKTEEFDNRLQDKWIMDRSYGKPLGLIFSNTTFWRETRRITTRILKDFGFGKNASMEQLIIYEFDEFIQMLKKKLPSDGSLHIDATFNGPMANVVWNLATGSRFNSDDPEFIEIVKSLDAFMSCGQVGGTSLLGAYPFLVNYVPRLVGFDKLHHYSSLLISFQENVIKEHRKNARYTKGSANFVDEFLLAIDNNQDKNMADNIYTDENLACVLNDLFLTGSETSSTATSSAIRLMVQYPEVQAKIQKEIDHVIGVGRMVSYSDRSVLRYTDATVLEILRFASPAPIGPRRAYTTCEFGGYVIPKNATVIVNYYSACREGSVWGDPHNFRPERFLSEDDQIINAEKLIIFGIGKRNCIGEVTARASLFIAIANLVKSFEFDPHPKHGVPSSVNSLGFTVGPVPFTIRAKIRQ